MIPIKVLIADDQVLFAGSLEIVLEAKGKGEIQVVGIAHDGKEALALVGKTRPDVVLMDVRMPSMDGVEATRRILAQYPDTRIMMLTTFDEDDLVQDALSSGALGYVLKDIEPEELVNAVRSIQGGTFLVSPAVGRKLVDRRKGHRHDDGDLTGEAAEVNGLLALFPALTRREAQVLNLVVRHQHNSEIAESLALADQTVKNYVTRLYEKLGVHDRLQAIERVRSAHIPRT